MDKKERTILYITLTQMRGLGPVRQKALLMQTGGIEALFREGTDRFSFQRQQGDILLRRKAEEIFSRTEALGIQVITPEDSSYPKRFEGLADTPVVLYALGKLRINDFASSVGIVGARRCTGEGKQRAIDAACRAAGENRAVISGMAKGVDSYAHTAAVRSAGYTIAVLGSGPEICYPKEHQPLYEKIIETGCILSEYPPGTAPRSYTFPRRNRIIAALSDELLVFDAGCRSGTVTTVAAWERKNKRTTGTLIPASPHQRSRSPLRQP